MCVCMCVTCDVLRGVRRHEQRDEVRCEVLQLSGVVDFERVALAGDDVTVLVDAAEPSAQQSAAQRHQHHETDFGRLLDPEHAVAPQLRVGQLGPHAQGGQQHAHQNQKHQVERVRPVDRVVARALALQTFHGLRAVLRAAVLLLQRLDADLELLAVSVRGIKDAKDTQRRSGQRAGGHATPSRRVIGCMGRRHKLASGLRTGLTASAL